jgi:toluene monooxygenase system protein E
MKARRTYWHLEEQKRVPSAYEIGTSRLLYYPERGFEVETPVSAWFRRHQQGSPLKLAALDRFRDPRETTYTKYVALGREKESFVDGLLRSAEESGYDAKLDASWLESLERWLPVLLYPCHGLQMVSGYIGQLAPTSELVTVFAFQAADEMRRIQRLAYRARQLEPRASGFRRGKEAWQRVREWQPFRRLIEELLVTYDFGDALVAHGLVVKPVFDAFFIRHGGRLAEAERDPLLSRLFFSFDEDCRWHESFTDELVRVLVADSPENAAFIANVVRSRYPAARAAVAAFEPWWTREGAEPYASVLEALDAELHQRWRGLGLEVSS